MLQKTNCSNDRITRMGNFTTSEFKLQNSRKGSKRDFSIWSRAQQRGKDRGKLLDAGPLKQKWDTEAKRTSKETFYTHSVFRTEPQLFKTTHFPSRVDGHLANTSCAEKHRLSCHLLLNVVFQESKLRRLESTIEKFGYLSIPFQTSVKVISRTFIKVIYDTYYRAKIYWYLLIKPIQQMQRDVRHKSWF